MHKLLARLIKRHLGGDHDLHKMAPFIEAINATFDQSDQDRSMLERSLMLTSDELNDINSRLRNQLAELEQSKLKTEETLAEQRAIINSTLEAIASFAPDGILRQTNEAGCLLMQITEDEIRENTNKQNAKALLSRLAEPDEFLESLKAIEQNPSVCLSNQIETLEGKHYEYTSTPIFSNTRNLGRIWSFRDITEAKKHQEILKHQAYHDSLTGLPNRSSLKESINHAIDLAKRNNTQVTVLFIDLDDFKKINDAAGHYEGDRFLIHISDEIKNVIRKSDTLGRLGGDEFVLMLEGGEQNIEIKETHKRILEMFSRPFKTNAHQYFVTCSIGISSYPKDGKDADDLIRKADMAMYEAKRNGKNTYYYFDDALAHQAINRVSMESQLREAIASNQFVFHYQPKIDLKTEAITGLEALVRWRQPDGKLMYPDSFIPLAEDTGMIQNITRLALRSACENLTEWRNGPMKDIAISINISASDFLDANFVDYVLKEVEAHDIPPSKLELELTESLFLKDVDRVIKSMKILKENGVLLSIDDFGTGYSSFGQLQNLDIDYLKIDKSFIQRLFQDTKAQAIVKSIIDLGENLNIKIVAEGIETEQDHIFLKAYGCHLGQGYHYAKPMDLKALEQFIKLPLER